MWRGGLDGDTTTASNQSSRFLLFLTAAAATAASMMTAHPYMRHTLRVFRPSGARPFHRPRLTRLVSSVTTAQPFETPLPPPDPLPTTPPNLSRRRAEIKDAAPFSDFLTDTFGRQHDYLRISLTERCNLRCTYCMPSEGVPLSPAADILTSAEIAYLSALFVSQGVRKIRLTGGEPTVRKDFMSLLGTIGALKSRGLEELCITTNGLVLERRVEGMVEAGLTGVNISLDTLEEGMFEIMTRRRGWKNVMRGIERVLALNEQGAGVKLKINCVVMRGVNDREICDFVELTRDKDLEVRFIEYMPFDGNKWSKAKMVSYQEMIERISRTYPGLRRLGEEKNETSKSWQVNGFRGKIGFITSMTHNFCGTCNRLRITSDGNLKVCLFGNNEVSLRDMIRKDHQGRPMDEEAFEAVKELESNRRQGMLAALEHPAWADREAELLDIIGIAVKRKKEKHAGMGQLENMKNRPMILIDESPRLPISPLSVAQPPMNLFTSSTYQRPASIPLHLLGTQHPSLRASSRRFLTNRYSRAPTIRQWPKQQITQEQDPKNDHVPFIPEDNEQPKSPRTRKSVNTSGQNFRLPQHHDHSGQMNDKSTTQSPHGRTPPSFSTSTGDTSPTAATVGNTFGALPSDEAVSKMQDDAPWSSSDQQTKMPAETKSSGGSTSSTPTSSISRLTHVNPDRGVSMVNVAHKNATRRVAVANGWVVFTHEHTLTAIESNSMVKGNVFTTAQIAGIQAAKRTSDLIPLCHPLPLSHVHVELIPRFTPGIVNSQYSEATRRQAVKRILIVATVSTVGPTGVEMEALAAVTGAALTLIDMCKAVDKRMMISGVQVVAKAGGKSGVHVNDTSTTAVEVAKDLLDRGLLDESMFREAVEKAVKVPEQRSFFKQLQSSKGRGAVRKNVV